MNFDARTSCPHCNKIAKFILTASDQTNHKDAGRFNYYRCIDCDLVFLQNIPNNLGDYYEKNYAPYKIPKSKEDLYSERDRIQCRMDSILKHKIGGSLLEIGPSYGSFALLAKESGFSVEAIEMDESCCRFLTEVLGVPTIHSHDVASALKGLGSFDVIALWHNIEHLPEPWVIIKKLSEHLNPGGLIVLATPTPEALQFKVLGRYWAYLDAPRHIYLLSRKFLTRVMSESSLYEVSTSSDDEENYGATRVGWSASFKQMADGRPLKMFAARVAGKILGWLGVFYERGELSAYYTAIYTNKKCD